MFCSKNSWPQLAAAVAQLRIATPAQRRSLGGLVSAAVELAGPGGPLTVHEGPVDIGITFG